LDHNVTLERKPSDLINAVAFPYDPACILSTSGTTGVPKGILLPHVSHVNLLVDNVYYDFSPATVGLHYSFLPV